ncbi:PEP-CTERM sorting domain-containing protein [Desulfonema magnum]|uniref:PEP-CTERM domain-containing protein n=1 Tax=Desulfonema magnum TaxID=45655 RepID=A0A975BWY8_9BACT|nr:PEP-CTERM sorting domain-containing protein [Desulfonema magnum]QTA93047.1 PEP-CTERM domain-containing protein [Desulfonema magnum]
MKKFLAALTIMLLVAGMVSVAGAVEVQLTHEGKKKTTTSTYNIDFAGVSEDNTTWKYKVTQNNGKALSHWNLGFMYEGSFIDMTKYVEASNMEGPGQPSVGNDGSTNWDSVNILKWDTPNEFKEAEFSFKIDYEKFSQDYDVEKVEFQVMAKAGTAYNTGYVPEAAFNPVSSAPAPADTPSAVPPATDEIASLPPEYTTDEPMDVSSPTEEETPPATENEITTPAEETTYVDDTFNEIDPSTVTEAVNETHTSGNTTGVSGGSGSAATPEPATMFLLASGLAGLAVLRKKFK